MPSNVAPGGTAVQSTLYQGSQFPAPLAIDNNFGNFTHTAVTDTSPFWRLDLTNEMAIYNIVLFNRGGGCCQWRLRDITVQILTTNLTGTVTNWVSPLLNPENAKVFETALEGITFIIHRQISNAELIAEAADSPAEFAVAV